MKEWEKQLKEMGIVYVNTTTELGTCLKSGNVLITSRCSKTKTGKNKATPKEFYVSKLNLSFYRVMEANGFYYGILSDEYGLHLCDEYLDYYDVHPSVLTPKQKAYLGELIKNKAEKLGYDSILFYNTSPKMSKPYFEMLLHSGLKIFYISKLQLFNELNKKTLF